MSKPWAKHQRPGKRGFPQKTRKALLRRDPVCSLQYPGCTEASVEADHRIPWFVAMAAGWSQEEYDHIDNGQGVCRECHRIKTSRESLQGRRSPTARPPANQHTKAKRKQRRHPGLKQDE